MSHFEYVLFVSIHTISYLAYIDIYVKRDSDVS